MTASRPNLADLDYIDKRIGRTLHAMLYEHGPANGAFLGLPFDQLVEHGPGHEFKWEGSAKPASVIELGNRGPFSALVLSVGQAEKYHKDVDIPLILKLDGHFYTGKATNSTYPYHTNFGSVEGAIEIGADAIGATFYLGNEKTGDDVERIGRLREAAHANGLPLVVWSYPRGPVPDATQADSLMWCHYAVSAAESLGADIVKTKFPTVVPLSKRAAYEDFLLGEYVSKIPEATRYLELEPSTEQLQEYTDSLKEGEKPNYDSLLSREQHIERAGIVTGAGTRTFVIYSGGAKIKGDAETALRTSTEYIMEAGGEGRIIGRNLWGVPIDEGLELANAVCEVMQADAYTR